MKKIGFKVYLNDQLISIHGMEPDGVVSQHIHLKKDSKKKEQSIHIHCGGYRSDTREYYKWVDQPLKPDDTIRIEIVEDAAYDSPLQIKSDDDPALNQFILKSKLKTYYQLKEELKDHLKE